MKIAVIGLGCWGLVLTKLLTNNFETVFGWSRKEDLSKELLSLSDISYTVPMKEGVESLNLAISAGIILYEMYKNGN